jgi:hypothetical protein
LISKPSKSFDTGFYRHPHGTGVVVYRTSNSWSLRPVNHLNTEPRGGFAMADDRMKQDDREKNMGAARREEDFGKQAPGRSKQDDEDFDRRGRKGTLGHDMEDEDIDTGQGGQSGRSGQSSGRQGHGGEDR